MNITIAQEVILTTKSNMRDIKRHIKILKDYFKKSLFLLKCLNNETKFNNTMVSKS